MKLSEICCCISLEFTFCQCNFSFYINTWYFWFHGGNDAFDATNVDHNVLEVDNNQEMLSTTDLRNVCSLKIGLGGRLMKYNTLFSQQTHHLCKTRHTLSICSEKNMLTQQHRWLNTLLNFANMLNNPIKQLRTNHISLILYPIRKYRLM